MLFFTKTFRKYLTRNAVSTTITNLNYHILKKMPIVVPSAEEQQRIIQKIVELMHLCGHHKERHTSNQKSNAQQPIIRLFTAWLIIFIVNFSISYH
ncbi:restriction endonuclease subunit S [Halomonas sp. IOP_6]|uniref:restriction endonuclease subunit S n=1 Tax=Halomonas sp. IOP_6 TaxID=2876583 RepID=UPI003FA544E4|nr:restriction endonuclease subunit S [Halomonas sp. IOP_6]